MKVVECSIKKADKREEAKMCDILGDILGTVVPKSTIF